MCPNSDDYGDEGVPRSPHKSGQERVSMANVLDVVVDVSFEQLAVQRFNTSEERSCT